MNVDDVLTYMSAIDLHSQGLLTEDDLEVIMDTLDFDLEDALKQMAALFLGTLDSLGMSWEELRNQWGSAQLRSA